MAVTNINSEDRLVQATFADHLRDVLGWDEQTSQREIAHYEARVAAERESQTQPDDHTADAARLGAPDVRTAGNRPILARRSQ